VAASFCGTDLLAGRLPFGAESVSLQLLSLRRQIPCEPQDRFPMYFSRSSWTPVALALSPARTYRTFWGD